MTLTEIQSQLEEKMVETLISLEQKLNRTLPIPTIQLKKLGRVAGRANSATNTLTINPDYCFNGHWVEMRDVTLPHEVAHLVADLIYLKDYVQRGITFTNRPHGQLWKNVMVLLGLPPERCHHMDTTSVSKTRPKPYEYECGCMTHMVGLTKHRRAQTGEYLSFRCRKCKKPLKYVGLIDGE